MFFPVFHGSHCIFQCFWFILISSHFCKCFPLKASVKPKSIKKPFVPQIVEIFFQDFKSIAAKPLNYIPLQAVLLVKQNIVSPCALSITISMAESIIFSYSHLRQFTREANIFVLASSSLNLTFHPDLHPQCHSMPCLWSI